MTERYPITTRALHWIVAILVIATIPIATVMQQDGLARPTQDFLFILHKNGGVVIFLLVVLRLAWRALYPAPPLPDSLPRWQAMAARATHWALYALLLVMAVSGYIRVRAGGFPVEMLDGLGVPTFVPRSDTLAETAQSIHSLARLFLIAFVLLHVAAALRHLIRRDGVFTRIWPPVGTGR